MTDNNIKNNPMRSEYIKSILLYIDDNERTCKINRDNFLFETEELKRKSLLSMLGKPLTETNNKIELISNKKIYSNAEFDVYEYMFKINDKIIFSGWLLKKANAKYDSRNKKAFIIGLHGGGGTPERVTGVNIDTANYNRFATRLLTEDTIVFVPQLLLWYTSEFGNPYDREKINRRLIQQGGSITALELNNLRLCIDYFSQLDYIDENNIGVVGLSYGGMYSLYLGAIDKRIKSVYSSCWFNDRSVHNWHDWTYFNAEKMFFDTEIVSMILPRKVFIELGKFDDLFKLEQAQPEIDRLVNYAKKTNNLSNLSLIYSNGGHEFNKDDTYIRKFIEILTK